MINAGALIDQFQTALREKWGYIYGKKHEQWTAQKQSQYAREYAGDPDRQNSVRYGGKWVGHWVTDCSGLFAYSFEQLGSSVPHGSNSIWNKCCAARGLLEHGKRTDGQSLKPGSAVFTSSGDKHNHIGLYVGNGTVIEAQGAEAGVTTSRITGAKWTHWAELTGVQFDEVPPDPSGDDEKEEVEMATVMSANGKPVKLRASCQEGTDGYGLYDELPVGTVVEVVKKDPDLCQVNFRRRKGWYIKTEFLVFGDATVEPGLEEQAEPVPDDVIEISIRMKRSDAERLASNMDSFSWQIIQQIGGLG